MVLRCAWGTCNADERYPERLEGGRFIRFPTPKGDLEKCKRWIRACSRPHEQLNVDRINKHKAVCSKHFKGGNGPTKEFPDPVSADGSASTPARKPPKRRLSAQLGDSTKCPRPLILQENTALLNTDVSATSAPCSATQTEEHWVSGMDMLTLAAENEQLKSRVKQQEDKIASLNQTITEKNREIIRLSQPQIFSVPLVQQRASKLKGLFKYYTGITYIRFCAMLSFLKPDNTTQVDYKSGRTDIKKVENEDGIFLTLCRLRHGFGLKDLATRFGLTLQSSGIVFNIWLDIMHYTFSQLSIWPHRDIIISNMPSEFRKDFPTSLIIIDGTEIKTQTPNALALQSQLYSDYKSSTTLKGLIGCDPNGSVMFVSELYTGSISDKNLTEQSGFYECLKSLKAIQFIKDGDAIMVDKGFNIHKEIADLGLRLNIPPLASSGCQMSVANTALTNKIARHRVHIERLICKVKTFKLLSHCVPTSLFKKVNQIWSVCCWLTLFQDTFVKDKDSEDKT